MNQRRYALFLPVIALLISACGASSSTPSEEETSQTINIYTGRHYDLEPAFDKFTEETGIKVDYLTGSDAELRERIKAEGENTEADIYMTVDAANLALGSQEDLFQPTESDKLDASVPDQFRAPTNEWFGLSLRARTVVYHPDRVAEDQVPTAYADLAEPEWKNRVCLRNSDNIYTQSLVASLIVNEGRDSAVDIVSGWADNAEIFNKDKFILESIVNGKCDVGLVNHYYLARELNEDPDFPVKLGWSEAGNRGTHTNLSGAGITKHARNPEGAKQLLEYLADEGQNLFVDGNFEYPVNPDTTPSKLVVDNFGATFEQDKLNAQEFGDLNADAINVLAEADYT